MIWEKNYLKIVKLFNYFILIPTKAIQLILL